MKRIAVAFIVVGILLSFFDSYCEDLASPAPEASRQGEVILLTLADSINPGTADYIMSGIERAENAGAPYLILQLDTPGGLLNSTRDIVKKMLNTKVPVVVFIGPRGAHAGSAGAIITFAADVAAMAPGTNIGAAHPVAPGAEKIDETMRKKMANDTAAFAESLAKAKGRNTEWAAKAVKESASITSEEALKEGVIDLVADDFSDLMKQLPGYKLKVPKAGVVALPKESVAVRAVDLSIKQRLVSFFADPNLAYLILSLGGLCIWVELSHPGLILPGVVGVVCVILSLVSFQMLPISYGALAFIILGLAMIIAEIYVSAYGLLGLGGLVSFIFGSLFLMDTGVPEFQISLGVILPTAATLAACALLLGFLVLKSRRVRHRSGLEALVGEYGEVREAISSQKPGMALVQGELWQALSESGEALAVGALVEVKSVRGMILVVTKRDRV